MSFLQPLFLAGLLAAALPIIIHLINRRKAVVRPFPALRLLRESHERIAHSIKLRQWILLALRVLAIIALTLALAKPFVFSSQGMTAEERMPTAVAIVVENGLPMEVDDWWDTAQSKADDEIRGLRPWDEAIVVPTSGDLPHESLSDDRSRLRDAAAGLTLRQDPGDLTDALTVADQRLATSDRPNRRIVVIGSDTDAAVDETRDLDLRAPIDYRSVRSDRDPADNLSIADLSVQRDGTSGDDRWQVQVTVENHGPTDRSGIELSLILDEDPVEAASVSIDAGRSERHTFEVQLDNPRLTTGHVQLQDDQGLQSDNRWHFVIHPRHSMRVLLVNGSPSSVPYDDELFFLTRAIEPLTQRGTGLSPSLTTADGLLNHDLDDYDVVLLANLRRPSNDQARALREFVEAGGGLMITMGDQVDEDAYNQHLSDLLPRPLRGIKLLAERGDPDAPIKATRLGHPQRQHPLFRDSDLPGTGALSNVSVYQYMLLDPAPSERQAQVLMTYQDNAPALVERPVGRGRVLLWTTSIDRDWTDFPVRTTYLPLISQSLTHLARRTAADVDEEFRVGQRSQLAVDDIVEHRAIIHDDSGQRYELEPIDGRIQFTPETPGIHTFFADEDRGERAQIIDGLTLAINVDRAASNLAPLDRELIDRWQGRIDTDGLFDAPDEERRLNLWSYFLFALVLFLLIETILGARRSVLIQTLQRLRFWHPPPEDQGDSTITS